MPNDKENSISIKCTTASPQEKKHIRDVFKENNINMAGFVLRKLREEVLRMREKG